jgi:hypothetical protein
LSWPPFQPLDRLAFLGDVGLPIALEGRGVEIILSGRAARWAAAAYLSTAGQTKTPPGS